MTKNFHLSHWGNQVIQADSHEKSEHTDSENYQNITLFVWESQPARHSNISSTKSVSK